MSEYDGWLNDLRILAEELGVDLKEDKFHYYTYYMRGYLPIGVVEDIKNNCLTLA